MTCRKCKSEKTAEIERLNRPPPIATFRAGAVQASVYRLADGYPVMSFERHLFNAEGEPRIAHNYDLWALAELRAVLDLAEAKLREVYQ